MLSPRLKKASTYEELMSEAYSKIPIYSSEWTDLNVSDPGITMLEYLMGVQVVQHSSIDKLPEEVDENLLKILGYTRKPAGISRVLIEPKGINKNFTIPADCRFMVGDISFETTRKQLMHVIKPKAFFTENSKGMTNNSDILRTDIPMSIYPFGKKPENGTRFYMVFDSSLTAGEGAIIYLTIPTKDGRNPIIDNESDAPIRDISFEYMSNGQYRPMEVRDDTLGFLRTGEFHFKPDGEWDEQTIEGVSGYVIRVTLNNADIDIPPVIKSISGSLFEAFQKQTEVITYTFTDPTEVEIASAALDVTNIKVYCREKKNGPYYRYEINSNPFGVQEAGRFYRHITTAPGHAKIEFSKEDFGYAPITGKDAIKVVIYSERMARRYRLTDVFGYDNQVIKLPAEHIVRDTFTVIAEMADANGELTYSFLKPNNTKVGGFVYQLDEENGRIIVKDAGNFVGATLYLGSMALTLGEVGNLREGNTFELVGGTGDSQVKFVNPAKGEGGCFKESIAQLRKRMVLDIHKPYSAVVEKDYEEIVKNAPGLVIKKAVAFSSDSSSDVSIAVLPGSMKNRPTLSAGYQARLEELVNKKRLIGQRVSIVSPRYVKVNVKATVYIRPNFVGVEEEVKSVIEKKIDYVKSETATFGDRLFFDEIFSEVEALESVAYVKELAINSASMMLAKTDGADIVPEKDVLLVPGEISIRTIFIKG